jgi:FkbM family methyltransferase
MPFTAPLNKSRRHCNNEQMPLFDLPQRARAKWREHKKRQFTREFREFCENLTRSHSSVFFVKIGAHDGVTDDPISDIIRANKNWTGVLVEPVPDCFARLKANYPDQQRFTLRQIAIGPQTTETNFYSVDPAAKQQIPDLPSWFDQLGSFDRNHILKHLDGVLAPFIVTSKVQVCPLSELLRQAGAAEVQLLQIDVEGADWEVLKTLDFTKHKPLGIFVEHKHLPPQTKSEMRNTLRSHGYTVGDCGDDFFAHLR